MTPSREASAAETERAGELFRNPFHHDLAVGARVVLAPRDVLAVGPKLGCPLEEIREVAVGQPVDRLAHRPLRRVDVSLRDGVSDVAAARVQQQPEKAVVAVHAHLEEVVAAPERAELVEGLLHQRGGGDVRLSRSARPIQGGREGLLLLLESDRDLPLDRVPQLPATPPLEPFRGDGRLARHHAAADVDADGRRAHGALRGDDAADRRADAEMDVRHGRDVT